MIVYGPTGCGKNILLKDIGKNLWNQGCTIKRCVFTISGYDNIETKVTIKQSKYHIVIEPNSNGFDRYLIQEIIQDYAKTQLLIF